MKEEIVNRLWIGKYKFILLFLFLTGFIISFFVGLESFKTTNSGSNSYQLTLLAYFIFPRVLSWLLAVIAIVMFLIELKTSSSLTDSTFILLFAIILATSYMTNEKTLILKGFWLLSISILGELTFLITFPKSIDKTLKKGLFGFTFIVSGLLIIGFILINLFYSTEILNIEQVMLIFSGLLLASGIFFSVFEVIKTRLDKFNQEQIALLGFILGFTPVVFWTFQLSIEPELTANPWMSLVFLVYPIIRITIEREPNSYGKDEKLLNTRFRNLLLFFSLVGLILTAISIVGKFNTLDFPSPPLYLGLCLFVGPFLVLIFQKKLQFQVNVDPEQSAITGNYSISPIELSPTSLDSNSLIYELRQKISEKIEFSNYYHFQFDESLNMYSAFHFDNIHESDLKFPKNSSLVQYMLEDPQLLTFKNFNDLPEDLVADREKIKLLGCNVILPLHDGETLLGLVALNTLSINLDHSKRKIIKLSSFIQNTIKNMSIISQQKIQSQRANNLDLLARIVQGVNYTLTVDDIFELIFTQTSQIVLSSDFSIILKDLQTSESKYVFYLENDERMPDKEKKIFEVGNSIEQDVINSGIGLIANNYPEICQERNYKILHPEIHSAIVVPLNTGANSIGCVFLGTRETTIFSDNQFNLIQSISDLVAGAIEKARLLEETNMYAHQLSILNDLTRKLTSTLEIDELYASILQNSLDLVKSDEARLAILEEKSQDLIYQAVIGKNSQQSAQKKIAKGIGLCWQSYNSQAVIVRKNLSEIKEELVPEAEYNFPIHSIMVVPMIVKDQVLGVIELINRNGGANFGSNDQELITALAAQAAIALENIRLYLRTDQELSKRVDELSVMQRIDRELNTNLDKRKVMEITLSWACHQLKCEVGWIGIFEANKLELLASQGYEPIGLEEKLTSLDIIKLVDIHDLQARGYSIQSKTSVNFNLHPESKTRITLPIQRDGATLAIMMLENFDGKIFDQNEINFLLRLCDHASIAIINSQLYFEVQAANQAKTEFVSLVAHELKNPMTSIKGYSELIASGAVGSINADQSKFLKTIRNNTDRMNILVSDLNDLSKIETGNLRLELREVDLIDIINETIRSTKRQFEDKNQTLKLFINENFPPLFADPDRLQQVLTNLVTNANKYTQENGEISIEVSKTENQSPDDVAISVAHIKVSDNGNGISDEDKNSIFEKFFRSEDPNIRASSGTGLGLNITRSLVEMQGGKIWFESEYQKGTTFHFTLPLAN